MHTLERDTGETVPTPVPAIPPKFIPDKHRHMYSIVRGRTKIGNKLNVYQEDTL